jgi:hypothetical protein
MLRTQAPIVNRRGQVIATHVHPVVTETVLLIERDPRTIVELAEDAGVHWMTLYFWVSGQTRFPRLDKLARVLAELGHELVILPVKDGYAIRPVH